MKASQSQADLIIIMPIPARPINIVKREALPNASRIGYLAVQCVCNLPLIQKPDRLDLHASPSLETKKHIRHPPPLLVVPSAKPTHNTMSNTIVLGLALWPSNNAVAFNETLCRPLSDAVDPLLVVRMT